MKQLSSIDVLFLAKELQNFIGCRFEKAYQDGFEQVIISLSKKGKVHLIYQRPGLLYAALQKDECENLGFSGALRKYLGNSKIVAIEQTALERILIITFEGRDWKRELVIELFDKGNMLLLEDDKIIANLSSYVFRGREVKRTMSYMAPEPKPDFRDLTPKEMQLIITPIDRSLAASLARRLGLGGQWAEEVCLRAGLDKTAMDLSVADCEAIKDVLTNIVESKLNPQLIYADSELTNVLPIPLRLYEKFDSRPVDSYIENLGQLKELKYTLKEEQKAKILRIISTQKEKLVDSDKKCAELNKKAEAIYSSYQALSSIYSAISKGREKKCLPTVLENLKKEGKILDFDPAGKTIMVKL